MYTGFVFGSLCSLLAAAAAAGMVYHKGKFMKFLGSLLLYKVE